jgi:hypothetical protein
MDKNRVNVIKYLYNKFLHRTADDSGIKTYYHLTNNNSNINKLISIITNSEEYKMKNFVSYSNSSRISHIDFNIDFSFLNPIITPLTKLINIIILTDNKNYTSEKLLLRANMIKSNLLDIEKKNRNFSIFPHLEYYFNTEKFDDSLKDFKFFKYFVLYISVWSLWKTLVKKEVLTDTSSEFVNLLKNVTNFNELFLYSSDYFINYFSIKISNRLLSKDEQNTFKEFILNEQSEEAINFLYSLSKNIREDENIIIEKNISELTKNLKRNPKVLIMIPYLESQNLYFLEKMMHHVTEIKRINQNIDFDFALDNEKIDKNPNDYTPWSKVKRIRNIMIHKYPIKNYDYLFLIDSDIVDYPHDFIKRAIGLNPNGITAPLVLVQHTSLFYDTAGFQLNNSTNLTKNKILNNDFKKISINYQPPYINDNSRLTEVDCVGSIYVVPTYIFSLTYGPIQSELNNIFELAGVKDHKIMENIVQYEDHPFYTDHYTICAAIKSNGAKVLLDNGSVAYHADLPIYGENWH